MAGPGPKRVWEIGPSDESALEHIRIVLEGVIGLAAWTHIFLIVPSKASALR